MKVGWYYHRLRAMTISELAHRVTERWKHRSDASFAESLRGVELGEAAKDVIALPERAAAPDSVKQALAVDAACLLRGDWKLFGWREVSVGTPPQWHRDPACGIDLPPDVLADQLNHRDLPGGADARTIWEINRWSEMVRLAMHGWVNGDIGAAQNALTWLNDWCDKNPVGYGINWTSPLEAGLRLVNFVWFDALVDSSLCALQRGGDGATAAVNALKRAQRTLAERIVPAHAVWVWRYRSFGSSANNHLLGELVGLLHAVKRWPALEKLVCSAGQLWQEISRCVLDQFAEDGGNKEQALHYHLFAWEMAWHAARIMKAQNGPVMDRLKKAAEFFVHVAHDGEQWEYGDNDDAQIVPLTICRERSVAEWRAWLSNGASCSSIDYWLGGFPQNRKQAVRSTSAWWSAPESGMAVCEHDGWKLRLDASPLGFGGMAAHGHCDALHLSIWDGSDALVIDPGTGGYFGMKEQRAALASWGAHNGPQPDCGFEAPPRMGTFLWASHHALPVMESPTATACTVCLRHEGAECVRKVESGTERSVFITDRVAGPGRFAVHWLLAPGCEVDSVTPHSFVISRKGRVWKVEFAGEKVNCELGKAQASERYGHFEETVVLHVAADKILQTAWSRLKDS
jgi:hypothetical protein